MRDEDRPNQQQSVRVYPPAILVSAEYDEFVEKPYQAAKAAAIKARLAVHRFDDSRPRLWVLPHDDPQDTPRAS